MFITVILIILAILLFSLIIFIHELGHFMTAKAFGVKVNEFALGMGPTLFKFKKNDTQYSIRAFPIGGFCAMEGEDNGSKSEGALSSKPVWQRIIVVAAGAIMNIILAFIFMFIILAQQPQFASTTIAKFADNAVTPNSGLRVGDTIVSIDGYKIATATDLNFMLAINKTFTADISVIRDGQIVDLPDVKFGSNAGDDGKEIIVRDFLVKPIEKNIITLTQRSFLEMVSNIRMTYSSFIGVITGKFSVNEVSGPVGIVKAITDSASEGLKVSLMQAINNIIMIMMLLSVSLGVMNLLPFPALDGGRLLFLAIEAFIRRPLSPKYEGMVHTIGFVILMLLILAVTLNDVFKLFRAGT